MNAFLRSEFIQVDKGKTADKVNLTEDQMDFLERRRQLRKAKGVRGGRQEAAAGPAHYDRSKGIFGGEPLGIFPTEEPNTGDGEVVRLETWERCEERYLRLMSTPTPRNYLEEMVDLTEKGIMWQFPIDNEQGIEHDEVGWWEYDCFWDPFATQFIPFSWSPSTSTSSSSTTLRTGARRRGL